MSSFKPISTPKPTTGKIMIHDFVAQTPSGESVWFIIGIAPGRNDEFLAAINNPETNINLEEYGRIFASGKGTEVPDATRDEIYKVYSVAS